MADRLGNFGKAQSASDAVILGGLSATLPQPAQLHQGFDPTEIRPVANFRVARDPFGMIGERESTMTRGRWSGRAKARTGSNADVSFVPPKIPDGEFSSVRFQGRFIRRCLPAENIKRFALVLRAPCYCVMPPRCVEDRSASVHHRSSDLCRFALPQGSSLQAGYAVPPFNAYRPHAPRSPAHSDFASPANTECHRCVPNRNTSATSEWFRAFTVRSFSTCRPLRPRGVH